MVVKILGTGCTKCKNLERKVRDLITSNSIDAEVKYIDDIDEIVASGIMMTPGLVIDNRVKSYGIIPKDEQILNWLRGEK